MKKTIVAILVVLLLCASVFALTACTVAREFKFESVSVKSGAVSVEYKAGEPIMGVVSYNEDAAVLNLNKDGTYVFTCTIPGAAVSETGTWTKKGKTITFDESYSGTLSGKTLTIEYGDGSNKMTFVMKRA